MLGAPGMGGDLDEHHAGHADVIRKDAIDVDRTETLRTTALLTSEGWSGYRWRLMFDVPDEAMTAEAWADRFDGIIADLPGSAWLVLVDAHY